MSSFNLSSRLQGRLHTRQVALRPRILATPLRIRRLNIRACAKVEKSEVLEKVISIITTQLGVEQKNVLEDTKFEDLGADSLDVVEIIMSFEEAFGITVSEDDAEKIKTVSEAADLIQSEIDKAK